MWKALIIFVLILVDSFIWFNVFKPQTNAKEDNKSQVDISVVSKENSVLSVQSTPTPILTPTPSPQVGSKLEEVVQKSLEGSKGSYTVAIKNLKTGESYNFNEDDVYEAASLYKLWVMGLTFRRIQDGELKEDQVLSQSVTNLNRIFNIDPEFAERSEGGVTYKVSEALNQMITISHNYAALLLSEKLKISNVSGYIKEIGLSESKTGTDANGPLTTASDTALFLEKLYQGKLANQEYSDKMLDLLKNQKKNNKLPKNLPEDVLIGHKTGEIGRYSHDAGIVFTPKGDYIIVVMSESSSPKGADERIADISKGVYEYFQK